MAKSNKLYHSESENSSLDQHARDYERIFRELDVNNSGQLTLAEFRNNVKILHYPVSESSEITDKVFASIDRDDDKVIEFDDLRTYLKASDDQIQKAFKKIDTNNDGKLNFDEFSTYMNETLNLNASKENMGMMFRKIAKKDGYISYNEFRNFLLLVPRSEGSRLKTAFMFLVNGLDISADGDVNMNQLALDGVGLFLAGGISGVVSRTCTAPFDRIKTFLISRSDLSSLVMNSKEQINKAISEGASPRAIEEAKKNHRAVKDAAKQVANPKTIRSPLIQAARTLYLQGGLRSFFVGNGLNTVKIFPESAVKLGVFEATKRFLVKMEGVNDATQLSSISTYLAGGIGGVSGQLTSYPIDTLKFRLQCSNLKSEMRGNELLLQIAKELFREGGIRSYYRGIWAGLGGMFPFAALDLGTFTTVKNWLVKRESKKSGLKEEDVKLPNYVILALGAFSGSFGASAVYPVNVIRTRLQAQGTHAHPYTYNGFFDALRQTISREGPSGLYKGLVPNLAKVAPAVSISYYVYERLKFIFKLEKTVPM